MMSYFQFMISFWGDFFKGFVPNKIEQLKKPQIPIPPQVIQPTVTNITSVNKFRDTFNPEDIISEKEFIDCNSMNEQQIQDFIISKGSFLKDYKINDHLTSYWVMKHCSENGLNPKVLITNIQKEQGSLSRKTLPTNIRKLNYLCGVGAYDPPRGDDPKWSGIDKQILGSVQVNVKRYNKAKLLKYPYTFITDKPESKAIKIQNASTMSLYSYTPFIGNTNQQIGKNLYESPFGNYLFWIIYKKWFGILI